MGAMAGGTICFLHGVIHVHPGKGRPVRFVAVQAEGNCILFQQMIRLCRPMGIMAVKAPLLYGGMLEFHLGL